jgi:hypothetical protein
VSKSHDRFDHVLVDMNQILHGILRRARGEDHAIKLLMYELDQVLVLTNPTQSLVLAIDGPAPAAKIATQRKRRFALLRNTQFKLKHFDKLRLSKKERARRLRSYQSELRSLQLTPGTESIQTMEQTVLYWAWQRLHTQGRPYSKILPRLKIYISSSRVPGEGEIKLLEWVNNFRGYLSKNAGQSIALVGGDADLLLEAMVIPPSWTHNVFVLRPDEVQNNQNRGGGYTNKNGIATDGSTAKKRKRKNVPGGKIVLCTSVWEMTRDLDEYCRKELSTKVYNPESNKRDQNLLLQLRTDLVLLLILNGNDYLPKTVATDFRYILDTYMTTMKYWLERNASIEQKGGDGSKPASSKSSSGTTRRTRQVGLVDPNTLTFRLEFCASFFRALGRDSPTDEERSMSVKNSVRRTYLSILNDMASVGFIPSPIRYSYFDPSDSNSFLIAVNKINGAEEREGNDDDEEEEEDGDYVENDDYEKFEDENDDDDDDDDLSNDNDSQIAIEDSVEGYNEFAAGMDNAVLIVLTLGKPGTEDFQRYEILSEGGTKTNSDKQLLAKKALEDLAIVDVIDAQDDITRTDYEWELEKPADSNIERYLAGLLWTLQTYQDGVCPNYGYNYGKCLAPTGHAIAEYFQQAILDKREVGAEQLIATLGPGGPISAGLACLAALPASVEDLVPEPYASIPGEKVEELYASCVDPADNWFDMRKFERIVEEEVLKLPSSGSATERGSTGHETRDVSNEHLNERRIVLGDHFWTVLSSVKTDLEHPFHAPDPPSDSFSGLKPSSRVKVTRLISIDRLPPRPAFKSVVEAQPSSKASQNMYYHKPWMSLNADHSDFGAALLGDETPTLSSLSYKMAFGGPTSTFELLTKKPFTLLKPRRSSSFSIEHSYDSIYASDANDTASSIDPSINPSFYNTEGMNALVVLNQLRNAGIVGDVEFQLLPSNSSLEAERFELTVYKGSVEELFPEDNVTVAQVRYKHETKKLTKQKLASAALNLLFRNKDSDDGGSTDPDQWISMSFDTLLGRLKKSSKTKKSLLPSHNRTSDRLPDTSSNPDGLSSVTVLKQLHDIGFVGGYEFIELPSLEEGVAGETILYVYKGSLKTLFPVDEPLSFTHSGPVPASKRVSRITKQNLASSALDMILRIVNTENDASDRWVDLTVDALKKLLQHYDSRVK